MDSRTTTEHNGSGPPVGLIVAPILLCVLIAALIFLWIKYREHKKRIQEQVLERMLRRNQGDTESIPSATTPGANSTHPSESESNKPLLSTSACHSDEPVQSPESASESVVFTDEQSEKGQLDPIEERDDNPDTRVRSTRPVQAAAQRQRMVPQEEPPESVEDQDPSESGGEQEEEAASKSTFLQATPYERPETFRERKIDSGYRSYRQGHFYRDMYGRQQPHLLPEQNDSDDSETEPKQLVPSRCPPVRARPDQSERLRMIPVEHEMPAPNRPGQQSSDLTGMESQNLLDEEKSEDDCDRDEGNTQTGKRLQNNVQDDSEDDSFAKKYIV